MTPLLTVPEVAAILRISPSMVYELIAQGDLPAVEMGRRKAVDEADLRAYVESRKTAKGGAAWRSDGARGGTRGRISGRRTVDGYR